MQWHSRNSHQIDGRAHAHAHAHADIDAFTERELHRDRVLQPAFGDFLTVRAHDDLTALANAAAVVLDLDDELRLALR
ncbi:MAG TPA: hypothetical protein VGN07_09975 [Steroidobacteraceae bacterium]|jgi:hypothetical protein